MRNQDQSQLIGHGFLALLAAIIIYNYWHWLVGALAIIGFMYAARELNRNNHK